MKIVFAVPCLNEENSIREVIDQLITTFPDSTICVINDGSTDETEIRARSVLRSSDILFNSSQNVGIANAIRLVAEFAVSNSFDALIQVDGDGQHPISSVKVLLDCAQKLYYANSNGFVLIGTRYSRNKTIHGTSKQRILGSYLLRLVISISYKNLHVSDPTSGLRVYCRDSIKFITEHYPKKWPEPIVIGRLIAKDITMFEIPVDMVGRNYGKSSLRGLTSIYFMTYTIYNILYDKFFFKRKYLR
jgi:glycosyltransferase involved in cell wall biosynthesis